MTTPRQEQLQRAEIDGVPFEVSSAEVSGGRRVVVHEFPQRDKPQAEDLGRATRDFSVTGFVVGDDYIQRAGALIAVLERPGPHKLVHPWHGELQVTLSAKFRVTYDSRGLGMATIDMPFIEAGEVAFPTAVASTPAQSRLAADAVRVAAVAQFDATYTVKGVPDFNAAGSVTHWQAVLADLTSPLPGAEALGYANKLADVVTAVQSTASQPGLISGRLVGALGLTSLVNTAQRWERIIPSIVRMVQTGRLVPDSTVAATPSRRAVQANTNATSALVRRVLLTQAVGVSSVMPATVHDQTLAVRDVLVKALDAESLNAEDDANYRALQAARAAVWNDLTQRARNAARITTYRPPRVVPALVVAHTLYGDATRADEIVSRNAIRHPGFLMPTRDLKVLTP